MRRFVAPVVLLAVAVAATWMMRDAADTSVDAGASDDALRVGTPLFSAARTPEWLQQPETDRQLAQRTAGVIAALPVEATAACSAVHRGATDVGGTPAETPVSPGRLQRILTMAAALEVLPGRSVITTEVALSSDATVTDGVLAGDIWLIGRGDPSLSTAGYADRFDDERPRTSFEALAADVVADLQARGVTTVAGSVVADETRFAIERDYVGPGLWTESDNAANEVGPLSAMLLNSGFDLWPAEIDPAANVRAGDPAASAAQALTNALNGAGIAVDGGVVNGIAPSGRTSIATVESAPIAELVPAIITDGTTAEMLTKEISVQRVGDGDRATGTFQIAVALGDNGLGLPFDSNTERILDGSGLADDNATTCQMLAATLGHPDVGDDVAAALPLIENSPLADCAPDFDGEIRVLAEAAGDTTGLAGRLTGGDGDSITFATVVNWPDAGAAGFCNPLQTDMLAALTAEPTGPAPDTIEPAPPVRG